MDEPQENAENKVENQTPSQPSASSAPASAPKGPISAADRFAAKSEKPETADMLYQLSIGEMEDMETLHGEVVRLIEEYRKEHGEPPEKMMWRYEFLHERHIADATRVKIKQGMFKA